MTEVDSNWQRLEKAEKGWGWKKLRLKKVEEGYKSLPEVYWVWQRLIDAVLGLYMLIEVE